MRSGANVKSLVRGFQGRVVDAIPRGWRIHNNARTRNLELMQGNTKVLTIRWADVAATPHGSYAKVLRAVAPYAEGKKTAVPCPSLVKQGQRRDLGEYEWVK